ncbi:MAG: integrin [Myxococcales bacterium]|nr:integrin [Myxococcales bacterium]
MDSGEQCDDGNTVIGDGCDSACLQSSVTYAKASNTNGSDFLYSITISADGSTLAVGARGEDSASTGINGDQTSNATAESGAVYVYVRNGASWSQQAYIKASNTGVGDLFGHSVSLTADGSTLAVGAYGEASLATGVDGDQTSNAASGAGAVYVYVRKGATWSQQAYVKASNTDLGDRFGYSVSLSGDGSTLAVGAPLEDSAATGVNSDQTDNTATDSGAVYVYARSGSTWSQQAYVKASNTGDRDQLGYSLSLSADGLTLAAGAAEEDSAATGVNGDQTSNIATNAGAVYVYVRIGSAWSQQVYLKASNTGAFDAFGYSVSVSADGSALAVGSLTEDSAATGVNGDQTNDMSGGAGAAYVYLRSGATWRQQAYVKASNTGPADAFGASVGLSADGLALTVGATGEDGAAAGTNGDQTSNTAAEAGAAYLYVRDGASWSQRAYVKASNTGTRDFFGSSVALSANGSTLAVGALGEASATTGVNGDQADNAAVNSGAVYIYR